MTVYIKHPLRLLPETVLMGLLFLLCLQFRPALMMEHETLPEDRAFEKKEEKTRKDKEKKKKRKRDSSSDDSDSSSSDDSNSSSGMFLGQILLVLGTRRC